MKKGKLNGISSTSNWLDSQSKEDKKEYYLHDSRQISIEMLSVIRSSGKSQKFFANKMGIHEQSLGKILKGNQNLTLSTIKKIEVAFGITIIRDFEQERLRRLSCSSSGFELSFAAYVEPNHLTQAELHPNRNDLLNHPHHSITWVFNSPQKFDHYCLPLASIIPKGQ